MKGLMFEHRHEPLLARALFLKRLARGAGVGAGITVFSLIIGMLGYRAFEHLSWTDAFVSAAMILSGMGPLLPLQTQAGKIFAGCYALYSGLALISVAGVMFAPVVHRFLHAFHIEGN